MHACTHARLFIAEGRDLVREPYSLALQQHFIGLFRSQSYKGQIHKPANTTKNDLRNPSIPKLNRPIKKVG